MKPSCLFCLDRGQAHLYKPDCRTHGHMVQLLQAGKVPPVGWIKVIRKSRSLPRI